MALTINSNISAFSAVRNINRTGSDLAKVLERISSGLRVYRSADDPAGLAVATNLATQEMSTRRAVTNSNYGISLVETAESASSEVTNILQSMRELAVQSSSETITSTERTAIQDEFAELQDEVARIAASTEYNDIQLTDGSVTELDVQVGTTSGSESRITIDLGDLTTSNLSINAVAVSSVSSAGSAITALDTALDSVNGFRSNLGAVSNRLESAVNLGESYADSLATGQSSIVDADLAYESVALARLQLIQKAGLAALVQAMSLNRSAVTSLLSPLYS